MDESQSAVAAELAKLYEGDSSGILDMLRFLVDEVGLSLDSIVATGPRVSLADTALEALILAHQPIHTFADVVKITGAPAHLIAQLWTASGLEVPEPNERAFSDSDLHTIQTFLVGVQLFGESGTLHFTRLMGSATGRMAEGAVSLFLANLAATVTDADEVARMATFKAGAGSFDSLPGVIETLLRRHAVSAVRRWRTREGEFSEFDTRSLAVGFVDLVGFTEQTSEIGQHELASLIESFEATAHDTVTRMKGRVVKLIGDEVMFVADSSDDACNAALALFRAFADGPVVPRGGLAHGPMLVRSGDYYGPVVNIASRLANHAIPGEMLLTTAVRDALKDDSAFTFESAGRRMLKGFANPFTLLSLVGHGDEE